MRKKIALSNGRMILIATQEGKSKGGQKKNKAERQKQRIAFMYEDWLSFLLFTIANNRTASLCW